MWHMQKRKWKLQKNKIKNNLKKSGFALGDMQWQVHTSAQT